MAALTYTYMEHAPEKEVSRYKLLDILLVTKGWLVGTVKFPVLYDPINKTISIESTSKFLTLFGLEVVSTAVLGAGNSYKGFLKSLPKSRAAGLMWHKDILFPLTPLDAEAGSELWVEAGYVDMWLSQLEEILSDPKESNFSFCTKIDGVEKSLESQDVSDYMLHAVNAINTIQENLENQVAKHVYMSVAAVHADEFLEWRSELETAGNNVLYKKPDGETDCVDPVVIATFKSKNGSGLEFFLKYNVTDRCYELASNAKIILLGDDAPRTIISEMGGEEIYEHILNRIIYDITEEVNVIKFCLEQELEAGKIQIRAGGGELWIDDVIKDLKDNDSWYWELASGYTCKKNDPTASIGVAVNEVIRLSSMVDFLYYKLGETPSYCYLDEKFLEFVKNNLNLTKPQPYKKPSSIKKLFN